MSSSGFTDPHVIEPTSHHTHTIIFLHGRGSSGEELAESLSETKLSTDGEITLFSRFPSIRWVFPCAKPNYSTVFKEEMTEWFDIYSLTFPSEKEDLQISGLRSSVLHLRQVIGQELGRLDGDVGKVILSGISQGEATALVLFLLQEHKFGGFMGFSGWLPLSRHIEGPSSIPSSIIASLGLQSEGIDINPSVPNIPVFLGHGRYDAYVDISLGHQVRDMLSKIGYSVSWKEYEGADEEGHWLKEPEEFGDIVEFIESIIGKN
ncbi:hypothetical protein H072_10309 [Dactylellina haptotyla CBS 200.50]|uniref:Phospholipase/carboxylesterase/thioesterase domain-containing protein n=1 Tax=Dactylellina haptotyla (strain CBS 200.50) TaxID=1284197 RepID=S8BLV2_DACHA|nr:hypothetical protein H072_10309 [Dactylellina haptotyla CBS 200.50]